MDITEVAQKGGQTTLKKYGSNHFKKLAEIRWKKIKSDKQNTTGQK